MAGSAEQYAVELDKKMKTMTSKLKAFGGVMETRKIVSYIEKDLTLSQDVILAKMPIEMNKIIAELLDEPEEI